MQRKDIRSPPLSNFSVFSICYVCFVISKLDMKHLKKKKKKKTWNQWILKIIFWFPSFFHVCGHVAKSATTLLPWPTAFYAMHAATYRIHNRNHKNNNNSNNNVINKNKKAEAIESKLVCSLEDLYKGCRKKMRISRLVPDEFG